MHHIPSGARIAFTSATKRVRQIVKHGVAADRLGLGAGKLPLERLGRKIVIDDGDAAIDMRPVDVARGLEADAAQVIRVECQGRAVIRSDVDHDVSRRELEPVRDVLHYVAQIVAHGFARRRAVEIAPVKQIRLDLLAQLKQSAAIGIPGAVAERHGQGNPDFGKVSFLGIAAGESRGEKLRRDADDIGQCFGPADLAALQQRERLSFARIADGRSHRFGSCGWDFFRRFLFRMKGKKVSQDQLGDLASRAKRHHLALAADSRRLMRRDLGHAQSRTGKAGRALARPTQARRVEIEPQGRLAAIGAKADQNIRVLCAKQEVYDAREHPVAGGRQPIVVVALRAVAVARSDHEVIAFVDLGNDAGDVFRNGISVGVELDDDVAAGKPYGL